jgi:hypothetical protein
VKITPDLIPHTKFHKGNWLLPVERPNWYYFRKGKNRNRITNDKFLKSVDRPLKELVRFLHKEKIKTTPSCAGHNFSSKTFKQIFDSLKKDAKEIRKNGLLLEDCETGKFYIYQNRNYRLPWTKKEFLKRVENYQQNGVIGIRLKKGRAMKKILKLKIPGARFLKRNSILLILTRNTGKKNLQVWKSIASEVKRVIKEDRK